MSIIKSSKYWAVVLSLGLLGMGLGFAISRNYIGNDKLSSHLALRKALSSSVGPVRFVEGRVTGNLAYAPLSGRYYVPRRIKREFRKAITRINLEMEQGRSPGPLSDLAILELLSGNETAALADLRKALSIGVSNGSLHSDASAIFLEIGGRPGNSMMLFRALTSADRAVAARQAPIEAYFNRALALEKLALCNAAKEAWKRYLELDPKSPWSTEAKQHLSNLSLLSTDSIWLRRRHALDAAAAASKLEVMRPLVHGFHQQIRLYAEEELLPSWARASLANKTEAGKTFLTKARALGEVLRDVSGDSMVADSIVAIERSHDPSRLAQGHKELAFGLALYRNRQFAAARQAFVTAAKLLASGKSPFTHWAELYISICDFQHSEYHSAISRLRRLQKTCDGRLYPNLLGRVFWMQGLISAVKGEFSSSLAAYLDAMNLFTATSETENLGAIYDLIAQNYSRIGDEVTSWSFRLKALTSLSAMSDPLRRQSILQELSRAAVDAGEPFTALSILNEAVLAAQEAGQREPMALALRRRAGVFNSLHLPTAALSDLRQAKLNAEKSLDAVAQRTIDGDILLTEGEIELVSRPERAVNSLSEALVIANITSYDSHLSRIHLLRAQAYQEINQRSKAAVDLESSLSNLEKQAKHIYNLEQRTSFLDQWRDLFDAVVGFHSAMGETSVSFDYAERVRAQCLLMQRARATRPSKETFAQGNLFSRALSLEEIRERLESNVAILEYAVLPDRLITWLVTRDAVRMSIIPTSRVDLAALVERFREDATTKSEDKFKKISGELYNLLIKPNFAALVDIKKIVFIPDDSLYQLSFMALWGFDNNSPLIESFLVSMAPSATVYIMSMERRHKPVPSKDPVVLVIGPSERKGIQPAILELPRALREASEVAGLYPRSQLLLGGQEAEKTFLAVAPRAEIIHFAAHSVTRVDEAFTAGLLFSDRNKQSPFNSKNLDLSRTKLVFLSACQTAMGALSKSEGALSPARYFLGVGVPTVIASLWDVEDKDAERFAVLFHRNYRLGLSSSDSLRSTALTMWHSGNTPAVWSAFEVFGAN